MPAQYRMFIGVTALLAATGLAAASAAFAAAPPLQTKSGSTAQAPSDGAAPDAVADLLREGETYRRAPDSQQNPDEVRTTQALNAEITSRNDLAGDQERADRAHFEAAQAKYAEASAAAEADRIRYDEGVRAAAEAQRRYEQDMADWRATVAACDRGDRARCIAGSQPAAPGY